jgi:hypothetical protein
MGKMRKPFGFKLPRARRRFWRDERSTTTMELAIIGPIFLSFMFLIFEVAYDMFLQEVLETTLAATAHQVQIGNAQNTSTGPTFVTTDFCANDLGLLNCNNVYIRIERYLPSVAPLCTDIYGAVSGVLPASFSGGKWSLQLGNYVGASGAGTGAAVGPSTTCISTTSAAGFCNAGADESIIMSAIYIAPSFMTALLPAPYSYTYNGKYVRAPFATEAFQSEIYSPNATAAGAAQQC